jgi:sugar phosphate isomerase/epimerase
LSNPEPAVRDEAIAFGRKWIDIARAVGSPSVRQHLSAKPGTPPSVERTAETLTVLADYGARQNVVINLENDAPGAEDPFFIVSVLRKANHPFLRALPDFGNSVRGHDRKYNETAVNAMFKFAFNMSHVKAVLQDKGGKRDTVDLAPLFAIARANSYRGYFSMEFDTAVGDPVAGTKELVAQSLRFLA